MSDSTLLTQLANRAKLWHTTTGVSQSLTAKAINVPDGNYSAFLAGKRGIGARVYLPIAEIGSLTKAGSDSQIQRPGQERSDSESARTGPKQDAARRQ